MRSQWINRITIIALSVLMVSCISIPEHLGDIGKETTYPSQFIFGDVYILKENEKINGNIAGIGTTLVIESGAIVTGDISLIGSNLELSGQVFGDINVVAGTSIIGDTAVIKGDINQALHQIQISPKAIITGSSNTYSFPSKPGSDSGFRFSDLLSWIKPSRIIILFMVRILLWILAALLVVGLFPEPTNRVIKAIRSNPVPAFAVGLISLIIFPIVAAILIISVCLSPIGLIMLIALVICYLWGWVSISFLLGNQIRTWLGFNWDNTVISIIGALSLGFLTMVLFFIPLLGILLNLSITSIGVGGVVFSRFGTYTQ